MQIGGGGGGLFFFWGGGGRLFLLSHYSLSTLPTSILVFSHTCKLFCAHAKLNSFVSKRFRTLCAKHPGWGRGPFQDKTKDAALKGRRYENRAGGIRGSWGRTRFRIGAGGCRRGRQ